MVRKAETYQCLAIIRLVSNSYRIHSKGYLLSLGSDAEDLVAECQLFLLGRMHPFPQGMQRI